MKRRLLYLLTGFTSLAMPFFVGGSTSTQVEQVGLLVVPRTGHAATALADGRVLITGGRDGAEAIVATAEVYDPANETSTAIGVLTIARIDHTATRLVDGRVLIAGGTGPTGALKSVEIFDPANPGAGFRMLSATMGAARARHTATLLNNGTVLIAGGDTAGTAEIFNPTTETFSSALLAMAAPRIGHSATLFSDDSVLFAGGDTDSMEYFSSIDQTFTLDPAKLTTTRTGHDAISLSDTRLLFFGGDTGHTIDEFNTSADTLSLKATMETAQSSATLLANGKMLVLGSSVAGLYSPDATDQTTAFTAFDEISVPDSTTLKRTGQTATELAGDKKILVAGGENAQHQPILQVATFNPARIWTDKDDYQPDDQVILSGSGWKPNENVYLYAVDNETEAWTYESTVAADANGGFVVSPYFIVELRHLGVQFHVTALGALSAMQADVKFTDAGSFDFDPASQSYINPPANTHFIENVTAPKNNGTFSASLDFSGTGGTQIPSSWVTISPGAQTFTTTNSADNKTWTVTINVPSGQADGVYTGHFAASVSGGSGPNAGPGTNLTITVDHTPPGPPSTPDLSSGDDTGVSNTDNITNKTNVTIGGNGAEANSTVQLFDEFNGSTNSLGTTTANGGGNWTKLVTLTAGSPPVGNPSHSITAKVIDAAGNISAPSGALSVTVDTSKPTVTVNQAQAQLDPTNSAPINFTATFNENVVGFTAADVSVSGTAGGTKTVTVSGTGPTYNIAVSGMTTPGTVIATIAAGVVTDTAGNTNVDSTSTDNSVTFNANVATTLILNSVSPASVSYGSTGTVTFAATLTSGGAPVSGANVNFSVDGSAAGSGMTNGSGVATTSYNPSALSVGNHNVQASFTATTVGGVSYLGSTSGTLQLAVTKAAPTITWNNPADITYGTALSGTQLNATASVPGTFTYTPAAETVLNAGAGQTLHVVFTPNDTTTYSNASADVTINVLKATPTVTWTNPADITYGTALDGTQLNATFTWIVNGSPVTVAGTAIYTPPAGTVLNAGMGQTLHVSFTPSNTTNYNGALGNATINVLKATPTINWSDPADITYGTGLGVTQLNATATYPGADGSTVPGTFTYTPASGTVLNAGNSQVLSVDFTPTNTGNYNSVNSTTVHINVLKKMLTASIINDPTKPYDGNTDATLAPANFQLTGLVGTDDFTVTKTTGTYNSKDVATADTVSTTLASGDFTALGATLGSNYNLPTTASGPGHITKVTLTASIIGDPTRPYNGNTTATLTSANYSLSPLVGSESFTVTQTVGAYNSKDVVAANTVTASLASGDFTPTGGADAGNYTLPTTASGPGHITAVTLTALIIGNPTRPYNCGTVATLAPANFQLSGLVGTENFTVSQTVGAYNSKDVVSANTVTASLAGGDFTGTNGGITGNYILPISASGAGHITPVNATVNVTPYTSPTTVYNCLPHTATGSATGCDGDLSSLFDLSGTTHTNAGTYNNDPWTFNAGSTNPNYNSASGTVNDSIAKAHATINVPGYHVTFNCLSHTSGGTATGCDGDLSSLLDLSGTTHTNAGDYPSDSWTFNSSNTNTNYFSESGTVHDIIDKANTTASVTSIPNPSTVAQPVTFTATVAGTPPVTCVPTGTVTFKDGATTIGTGTLNGSGQATFSTSSLSAGSHSITAVYGADSDFHGSTSSSLTQSVQYRFIGFLQPVDNTPIWNSLKAGQTVPVKWQLMDYNNTIICDVSTLIVNGLTSIQVACPNGAAPVDPIEQVLDSPGSTVFRCDGTQYIFNWQTSKSWAGTCRSMTVKLADGTLHTAWFTFK